jgi:acyl-CoA reductase-like NAD-dependent aldehyde dehydrogenase
VLSGGTRSEHGLFYPPTVLVDVDHTMACMRDETFGPLLPVMKVANEEEAIALANDSNYGLSSSIWTTSRERGERVSRRIEAGAVNVNNAMVNAFQFPLPMGGWKESGLGHRMGGPDGIRKYCRQQSFVSEKINFGTEIHWYPYTQRKARLTSRVLRLIEMHDWPRRLGRKPKATE